MDYPYVWAWGKVLNSKDYFIQSERDKAKEEKAPENAIFRDDDGGWSTVDSILSGGTKQRVEEYAEAARRMAEPPRCFQC